MHERCARGREAGRRPPREIDAVAREVLAERGARSNFLNYHGFPAVICTSPNDVIVHGIPGDVVLEDGDIVSLDCGAIIEGWHADAAITVPVGEIDDESQQLIDVTRAVARRRDRAAARRPARSATSAPRCRRVAEGGGYSVVREYVGHGIGTAMHEDPQIPNYAGGPNQRFKLKHGPRRRDRADGERRPAGTRTLADGWTVVTVDGKPLRPLRAHHRAAPKTAPRSSPSRSRNLAASVDRPAAEDEPAHDRDGREQRRQRVIEQRGGRRGAPEGDEVRDHVVDRSDESPVHNMRDRDEEAAREGDRRGGSRPRP